MEAKETVTVIGNTILYTYRSGCSCPDGWHNQEFGCKSWLERQAPYKPDGIAYGLLGPSESSELTPSRVVW